MTEPAPETEKAPNEGREKAKPGATFFTLTWWLIIGGIAGMIVATLIKEGAPYGSRMPIGFFVLIPLAIGVIQRTTSDKEITWYKTEARFIGAAVGALAILNWY